jgi:protein translocase SecG subunit
MDIKTLISTLQIFVAIMTVILIVIQGGGAGLSVSGSNYANYFSSKRGFDRILFLLTIVMVFLFFLLSVLIIFIKK